MKSDGDTTDAADENEDMLVECAMGCGCEAPMVLTRRGDGEEYLDPPEGWASLATSIPSSDSKDREEEEVYFCNSACFALYLISFAKEVEFKTEIKTEIKNRLVGDRTEKDMN
jgi:hypothetical protein